MGLYNGVKVKSVKGDTGSSRDSFSGYNISLEAKEINQPFFIDDLEDAGFNIIAPLVPFYLLQENGFKLLQENASGILLDHPVPLQLVADYQFNNNLIDSVGGNNGTGTNITFNSGSFGNEAVFNGSTSEVRTPNSTVWDISNGTNDIPIKIEVIVKFGVQNNQYVLAKCPSNNTGWELMKFGTKVYMSIYDGLQQLQIGCDVQIDSNGYSKIVVQYDGSGFFSGLDIQVNEISSGIVDGTSNYTSTGLLNTTTTFGRSDRKENNRLNGAISQIKVYK